jgi:hypothetical protein
VANFRENGFHKSREFLDRQSNNDGVLKEDTILCSQLLEQVPTNQRHATGVGSSSAVRFQHSSRVYH